MTLLFRADDVPVPERAEYWRHVIGETLIPLEPLDVPDRLTAGDVGALQVGELSASAPGGARRTAAHIRRSDPDLYKIDVLVDGRGVIEQGDREAALGPGDFTLVDLSSPACWSMGPARVVALTFPTAMLPLRRDDLGRLRGVRMRGDHGTGALFSSLAQRLIEQIDNLSRADGARLGTAVLDLLAAGLATRLDRASVISPESRQRALLLRVRAFIEEWLGDPELSPRSIAAAHYISIRYLHKLFEAEQTTVADWIRRRRLERCRRDLLDPAQRATPVGAIGLRWGFRDAAHFNRLFRAAYGLPPGECRERQRRSALPG
jgi:AraC-like DNA-binding protein